MKLDEGSYDVAIKDLIGNNKAKVRFQKFYAFLNFLCIKLRDKEIQTLAQLNHKHIVQFVGVCTIGQNTRIVTAWRELKSLNTVLRESEWIKPLHSIIYCHQTASVSGWELSK